AIDRSAIPVMYTIVLGLLGNAAAVGAPVFDRVPRNQQFPYVHLQSPLELNDGAFGAPGKAVTLDCHVFTSDEADLSSATVTSIVSNIRQLTYFPTVNATPYFTCKGLFTDNVTDAGDEILQDGQVAKHFIVSVKAWFMPTGA